MLEGCLYVSLMGICDKYAGHMITTDKKCVMLELLLISKSSKTLKIILENDSAEHYERLWFKNIILLAKIYSNLTENFGKWFLGRKTYILIFLSQCQYLET